MSNATTLRDLLEASPDEPALYAMVVDALEEECGYTPESAREIADQTVRLARSARALEQATYLMRPDEDSNTYLRSIIRRCHPRRVPPGTLIVVVAGDQTPRWPVRTYSAGCRVPRRGWITVGAEWILARWADHLHNREHRRAAQARADRGRRA